MTHNNKQRFYAFPSSSIYVIQLPATRSRTATLLRLRSSYKPTHVLLLRVFAESKNTPLTTLMANLLPDRDGRFVQNSRTISPQLG